jgi:hypothetical protein
MHIGDAKSGSCIKNTIYTKKSNSNHGEEENKYIYIEWKLWSAQS